MKTTLTLTLDLCIELPMLPNFIKAADGQSYSIQDFDKNSLEQIALAWKHALFVHAEELRKKK